MAGTVTTNITMGAAFDAQRFKNVIKATQMSRDLELLPNGKDTEIGERGVTLSGGQRARVGLARALYADADIYLLDDPLSAVDPGVSRALYEQCIRGFLRKKTVVLVTHQTHFVRGADAILLMTRRGGCAAMGTFDELRVGEHPEFAAAFHDEPAQQQQQQNQQQQQRHSLSQQQRQRHSLLQSTSPLKSPPLVGDGSAISDAKSLPIDISPSGKTLSPTTTGSKHYHTQHSNSISGSFGGAAEGAQLSESNLVAAKTTVFEEEKSEMGGIKWSVYADYIKACGGMLHFLFIAALTLVASAMIMFTDFYLARWVDEFDPDHDQHYVTYAGLVAVAFLLAWMQAAGFFAFAFRGSHSLHVNMLHSVSRAATRFFDVTPKGRLLNLFANDLYICDENLPVAMDSTIRSGVFCIATIAASAYVVSISLAPLLPLLIYFYFIRRQFLRSSRDVKRLENVTRAPVHSHLSSSLDGLTTIRAMRAEHRFVQRYYQLQDVNTRAWMTYLYINRWIGFRVDAMSAVFITGVAAGAVFVRDDLDPGLVGLALTYCAQLMGSFQYAVRMSADTENFMTSVERVLSYSALEFEAPLTSATPPQPDWPANGRIEFNDVSLTYAAGVRVLKSITCSVAAGEKVGVIGRTGAGKSSLMTALFRLQEFDGDIVVDGLSIKQMGLHELRSRITMIPQEPCLFAGTVRHNLDPFNEHTDEALLHALEQVSLRHPASDGADALAPPPPTTTTSMTLPTIDRDDEAASLIEVKLEVFDQSAATAATAAAVAAAATAAALTELPPSVELYDVVTDGGGNFSVGQAQLLCLARAIVKKSKVIVMDEATANVDLATDALIQTTIRRCFADCTMLVIAHRLASIIDSDKVIVLDAGRLVEFGAPSTLLDDTKGRLHGMVAETGPEMAAMLHRSARTNMPIIAAAAAGRANK
jgi:ABC-type multidrug transport system fused ATPase/permease subunit